MTNLLFVTVGNPKMGEKLRPTRTETQGSSDENTSTQGSSDTYDDPYSNTDTHLTTKNTL